jgi:tetratricopeptide (TPR) repeat protein
VHIFLERKSLTMCSGLSSKLGRHRLSAVIILVLLCFPLAGYPRQAASPPQAQSLDAETFRIRAYAHHEMALLFLAKGDVDKAIAEARAIIQPPIPPEMEKAVATSMSKIADKLKDVRRFDLAQTLLDETLKVTEQVPNRISLLDVKAALFLLAGENDKAIESWKRARDLEARIRF